MVFQNFKAPFLHSLKNFGLVCVATTRDETAHSQPCSHFQTGKALKPARESTRSASKAKGVLRTSERSVVFSDLHLSKHPIGRLCFSYPAPLLAGFPSYPSLIYPGLISGAPTLCKLSAGAGEARRNMTGLLLSRSHPRPDP